MTPNVNKVFIVTPAELTVIAAAKNIRGIFSIQNTEQAIDKAMVIQALNHLYQHHFIYNAENDSFELAADLKELIVEVEEAKSVVLIRHFRGAAGMKAIYISRRLVAIEQRKQDLESIRIYEIPRKEMEDFLQEDVLQRADSCRSILDEERLLLEGIQKRHVLQDEEAEAMGNIVTMVEKMVMKSKKVNYRMVVKHDRKGIQYTHKEKELMYLKEQDFLNSIMDMIEEELDDIS